MQIERTCIRFLLFLAFIIVLSGCALTRPTLIKAEIAQKHQSETFIKKKNYLSLAHYWDNNAKKQMISFHGASFLLIWEHYKKAEITIGNGPYYGLIELVSLDEETTQITFYAWGGEDGMASRIHEWVDLLKNAPE